MSHELHYTSAPRGLKPGSKGFCTVAQTSGLPAALASRLESLSGYRQVYPPHDPNADRNPACRSHLLLTQAGQTVSVLSWIGFAGLDYTDRSNVYAHHVVLAPGERPAGGPAWLAAQPGFLETAWKGDPRPIEQGRRPPQGDRPAAVCGRWRSRTGDAGWAGVLAETFLQDPRKIVYLIVPIDLDPLPLLEEALALVPPDRRWDVAFSTYFTSLPPGLACHWRCVLAGSPEAAQARRMPGAVVIDLTGPLGKAQGGPIVEQARTGVAPPPPKSQPGPRQDQPREDTKAPGLKTSLEPDYDLIPDLPPPTPIEKSTRPVGRRGVGSARRPSSMTYQFAGILSAAVVLLVGGIWLVHHFLRDVRRQPAVQVAVNDRKPEAGQPANDPSPSLPPSEDAAKSGSENQRTQGSESASKTADLAGSPPSQLDGKNSSSPGTTAGSQASDSKNQHAQKNDASPKPQPDPQPNPESPKDKPAEGPKVLAYWGLPRRIGSQAGGSGTGPENKPHVAPRPVKGLRLIGLDDPRAKEQRLEARPGDAPQSLAVVRGEGGGSGTVSTNEEVRIGQFRWVGPTIEFELNPTVRDSDLLTAFLDCVLEVQTDGGSSEYLLLTDPDALAHERSEGKTAKALSLPDHWPFNKERPEALPFDSQAVFGTGVSNQRALINKSNHDLLLISCQFHAYPGRPSAWKGTFELLPEKDKLGEKLARPGQDQNEATTTTVSIDRRSGRLTLEFDPSPILARNDIEKRQRQLQDLSLRVGPLNEKQAKGQGLSGEEQNLGRKLHRQAVEIEAEIKMLENVLVFNNIVVSSGIEMTVGIEVGGELFLLPTVRSPGLDPGGK